MNKYLQTIILSLVINFYYALPFQFEVYGQTCIEEPSPYGVTCTQCTCNGNVFPIYMRPMYADCYEGRNPIGEYNGIIAYSNNGDDINTSYHCTEYVKRFYHKKKNKDTCSWTENGYDYFDTSAAKGLDGYANGGSMPPYPGDILGFEGGQYGHVAIVTSIAGIDEYNYYVNIIEQNWSTNKATDTLKMSRSADNKYSISNRQGLNNTYVIEGWLRPPCTPYEADPSVRWHPNGTLLRCKDCEDGNPYKDKIYLLQDGFKRWIPSPMIFNAHLFDWCKVIEVDQNELDCFNTGSNVDYPNFRLVQKISGAEAYKVYLVTENRYKRWITSADIFEALGYNGDDIEHLSENDVNSYEELDSSIISVYPEGTLIRKNGDDKVFIITNGKRRWIETADVFTKLGYNSVTEDVIEVSQEIFDSIDENPTSIDLDAISECTNEPISLIPVVGKPNGNENLSSSSTFTIEGLIQGAYEYIKILFSSDKWRTFQELFSGTKSSASNSSSLSIKSVEEFTNSELRSKFGLTDSRIEELRSSSSTDVISYSWTVPNINSNENSVQIIVYDASGNSVAYDVSDDLFTISSTAVSYSISGYARDENGVGLQNAAVAIKNLTTNLHYGFTLTDANGYYHKPNLAPGTYHVGCGGIGGYEFEPPYVDTVVIDSNNPNATQDFTGYPVYSFSGYVRDSGGSGIPDVTIHVGTKTVTTDSNGYFHKGFLKAGTYPVSLEKMGYVFTPSSMNIVISSNNVTQNFTGYRTYSVSGYVTTSDGIGIAGVTINISGDGSATTDSTGYYSKSGLINGNYTCTPSHNRFQFTPPSLTVVVNSANVLGQNFIALEYQGAIIHIPGDYSTIQAAIDAAVAGDVVEVAAGTYSESITVKEGVKIRGAGIDNSIIDGTGSRVSRLVTGADKAEISGFTIKADSTLSMSWGVYLNGTSPTIKNCKIINATLDGIGGKNSSAAIADNIISNNVRYGISLVDSSPAISQNTISQNTGAGISLGSCTALVTNNLIGENGCSGIEIGGTPLGTNIKSRIKNNVIVWNGSSWGCAGIRVNGAGPEIINNAIYGGSVDSLLIDDPDLNGLLVMNNVFDRWKYFSNNLGTLFSKFQYNGGGEGTNYYNSSEHYYLSNIGTGNIYTDFGQWYINTADGINGDYHLTPGAEGINAGNPDPAYNDPDGTRNDMGAYGGPGAILDNIITVDWSGNGDYTSIQGAINAASYGDIVKVKEGTYYEHSIQMKAGVDLIGAGASDTIIDGSTGYGFAVIGANNTTLSGFTIRTSTGAGDGVQLNGVSDMEISYNIIEPSSSTSQGWGIIALNCPSSVLISNNIIRNHFYSAIELDNSSPIIKNNLLINNALAYSNDLGGVECNNGSSPVIINNTIDGNTAGIAFESNSCSPKIRNNIITNNKYGISGTDWVNTITLEYNDVWGSTEGNYFYVHHEDYPVGNISSDPLYIDRTGEDFHLQSNSPCIDAGDPNSIYNDNKDNSRNDMGMYGGPSGSPPATYDFTNPEITISQPAEGQTFTNSSFGEMNIPVNGQATDDTGVSKVILNGITVVENDPPIPLVNWQGQVTLSPYKDQNVIKVLVYDVNSNIAIKKLTVNYRTAPQKPWSLAATVVSANQVDLNWSWNQYQSSQEEGFKIERKTGTSGTYQQIGSTGPGVTSYSDTSVNPSTTYYYQVMAYNSLGNSGYSDETSATTPAFNNSPDNPSNPTPPDGSLDQGINVTLSWQGGDPDSADTVRYDVYFGTSSNPPLVSSGQTGITYNPGTLNYFTFSYWKVVATDNHGASSLSPVWSFVTQAEPVPAAPSNLSANTASSSQVDLTWTDISTNEIGFKIERKIGVSGTWSQIYVVGASTSNYSDTGLNSNTTYYYRVRAYNISGNSGYSNETNAHTPAAPEINVKQGGTDIPSGTGSYNFGTVNVGSSTTVSFTIQNIGTANLNLTGNPKVAIGGANAGDFSVTQQPTSPVGPSGSTTFTLRFAPTATGTHTATVSMANNDSDENPYTFTLTGTGTCGIPAAATLQAPSGTITTSRPTYTWNAVTCATWYYLWVNGPSGNVIKQWYTAAQAGCVGGTGTCSVTPVTTDYTPSGPLANGNYTWWVQTWNASGYGPWSSGLSFTVSAPPPAATLVAPSGTSCDSMPTYIWNAVSSATWYYLWVNGPSGNVLKQWYTAAQAHCASGTGMCAVAPATTLASGAHTWWIQTWNSVGYGPWSAGKRFTVTPGSVPGAVTLISPTGTTTNPPPWYWWYEDSCATWYYLWVNGPSGTPVIQQWYTAAQAQCNGTWCWVTNSTSLPAGTNTWWIQTWNSAGYGPWSSGMGFTVSASAEALAPITIRKSETGTGTIFIGAQACGPACVEVTVPYVAGARYTVQVVPAADSRFVQWETADGVPLASIYYAQPGETVIAVFEKK